MATYYALSRFVPRWDKKEPACDFPVPAHHFGGMIADMAEVKKTGLELAQRINRFRHKPVFGWA
jgi:hypothetical protein